MMHYPCGKFGDMSFSRFGFIVNYRRPEWGVFVQLGMVVFQILGKHGACVPAFPGGQAKPQMLLSAQSP